MGVVGFIVFGVFCWCCVFFWLVCWLVGLVLLSVMCLLVCLGRVVLGFCWFGGVFCWLVLCCCWVFVCMMVWFVLVVFFIWLLFVWGMFFWVVLVWLVVRLRCLEMYLVGLWGCGFCWLWFWCWIVGLCFFLDYVWWFVFVVWWWLVFSFCVWCWESIWLVWFGGCCCLGVFGLLDILLGLGFWCLCWVCWLCCCGLLMSIDWIMICVWGIWCCIVWRVWIVLLVCYLVCVYLGVVLILVVSWFWLCCMFLFCDVWWWLVIGMLGIGCLLGSWCSFLILGCLIVVVVLMWYYWY